MPFKIVRNDLTKMNTEAIVNTANGQPLVGPGCDYAVYMAAGCEKLYAYRQDHIGVVKEGDVFITPGFDLPAKYIIHAVSPLYIDGEHGEEELLRSCYRKSLALAAEHGIKSIAFPLISTGSFGYPKEEGMRIAVDEINAFLLHSAMEIWLVVFDGMATRMGKNLYPDLEAYIDHNYVEEKRAEEYGAAAYSAPDAEEGPDAEMSPAQRRYREERLRREFLERQEHASFMDNRSSAAPPPGAAPKAAGKKAERPLENNSAGPGLLHSIFHRPKREEAEEVEEARTPYPKEDLPDSSAGFYGETSFPDSEASVSYKESALPYEDADIEEMERKLAERIAHMSDTFPQYLFFLIDQKGLENTEVYKRAIIDKKVFSKIKNNPDYHPQKLTALCLCIGAKLNLDESKDLLARAGYALSPCDKTDIIFSYFIEHEIYDMIELDIQLEEHGLPCIIT